MKIYIITKHETFEPYEDKIIGVYKRQFDSIIIAFEHIYTGEVMSKEYKEKVETELNKSNKVTLASDDTGYASRCSINVLDLIEYL